MTRKAPARKSKQSVIREREMEMGFAAFMIFLVIKYGGLSDHSRSELMKQHFHLSYRDAHLENRIEDICRAARQREIASQPGPWPAGYFDNRPGAAT